MTLLEVQDLRTWFAKEEGEVRAVDGVSFHVGEGEAVGLVGESGCGKTVTALSIAGLVPDPPGHIHGSSSIRLRGTELVGLPERRLRRFRGKEVAMVFQDPMSSLNPVRTVGSQISEVVRLHGRLGAREAKRRTVQLLREVEIPDPDTRYREYPHQLSGGMRQRVMIAMALSCEPSLLVADEPTTALDVTIQAQLLELLSGLRRERKMGLLLITHDLAVVAELCDRVVVMYAGKVVETGRVKDVFSQPAHPYTRGLLGSLPRIGSGRRRLAPIVGGVPDPAGWPSGCRFHPRCPHAWGRCSAELPSLRRRGGRAHGEEWTVRCWLEEEPLEPTPDVGKGP